VQSQGSSQKISSSCCFCQVACLICDGLLTCCRCFRPVYRPKSILTYSYLKKLLMLIQFIVDGALSSFQPSDILNQFVKNFLLIFILLAFDCMQFGVGKIFCIVFLIKLNIFYFTVSFPWVLAAIISLLLVFFWNRAS
jgi:hypothetical protein